VILWSPHSLVGRTCGNRTHFRGVDGLRAHRRAPVSVRATCNTSLIPLGLIFRLLFVCFLNITFIDRTGPRASRKSEPIQPVLTQPFFPARARAPERDCAQPAPDLGDHETTPPARSLRRRRIATVKIKTARRGSAPTAIWHGRLLARPQIHPAKRPLFCPAAEPQGGFRSRAR